MSNREREGERERERKSVPFGSFVAVLSGLFFSSENRFVTVSWLRLFCVSASAAAAFAEDFKGFSPPQQDDEVPVSLTCLIPSFPLKACASLMVLYREGYTENKSNG